MTVLVSKPPTVIGPRSMKALYDGVLEAQMHFAV